MKITPHGIAVIETDSHISHWVEAQGRLDIQEGQILPWLKNVKIGGVCLDVGAFIGDTALTMSKHVGPMGIVIAVEPNPLAFDCLQYNTKHNCHLARNAIPQNFAVGTDADSLTTVEIVTDINAGASYLAHTESAGSSIEVKSIDWICWFLLDNDGPLSFIKIDVEGWEVKALLSAQGTLAHQKPDLLIEINHGALARQGNSMTDVTEILLRHGYTWEITDKSLTFNSPQFDIFATFQK